MPTNTDPLFGMAALTFAIVVGGLLGVLLIRASVSLFNALAGIQGMRRAVREPGFGKALGIAIIIASVGGLANALAAGAVPVPRGEAAPLWPSLIACAATLLIEACLLMGMLSTTFIRGLLISLIHASIASLIVSAVYIAIRLGVR